MSEPMSLEELEEITAEITFRDWRLRLGEDADAFWMQWVFIAPDVETGEVSEQRCRKWRVSRHSAESEVVQTAFLAVLVACEHEAREDFKFEDERPYGPHVSVSALVAASANKDVRADAP